MTDKPPARPGSPDYYRERAQAMIREAEAAPNTDARSQFLMLAEQWQRLAETVEHPHW